MSDNGSFNYEEAKIIADKLENLTKLYEEGDGSNGKSMAENDCPTPIKPVESDDDPVYVFDVSSNPTYPEDVVLDGQDNIRNREKDKDGKSPTIHILTQDEIDLAQRARNLLDANNERERRISSRSKSSSSISSKNISKRKKDNKTDGDSEDSGNLEGILTKKQKKNFDWSSRAESGPNLELSYTPGAVRFSHAKRGYATNIKEAVKGFNQRIYGK
ncbi:hypothetical protein DFH28DRAFT_927027 [Melampsora americana]|nr:hypothetical protein DFH28DRAFT_927027 [Melampsora americana]